MTETFGLVDVRAIVPNFDDVYPHCLACLNYHVCRGMPGLCLTSSFSQKKPVTKNPYAREPPEVHQAVSVLPPTLGRSTLVVHGRSAGDAIIPRPFCIR